MWNKEPESQAERAGCMTWRESLILQDLCFLIQQQGGQSDLVLKHRVAQMLPDSWRCQLSPTGPTSSNPTQEGEQAHPRI